MKKNMLALAAFLTVSFAVFGYDTQSFYAPHPDGEYDNNNVLVNPAEMDIERMKESVVHIGAFAILKSADREFYYPDNRSVGGTVIAGRYILTVGHAISPGNEIEIESLFGVMK